MAIKSSKYTDSSPEPPARASSPGPAQSLDQFSENRTTADQGLRAQDLNPSRSRKTGSSASVKAESEGDRDKPAMPLTSQSPGQPIGQITGQPTGSGMLSGDRSPAETPRQEEGLRPSRLSEYIGQKSLKEVLDIAIKAARSRQEPLDHLLLYGPPGLGKTTMALILAQEMGVDFKITTAPALERPRDIAGLLVNLKKGDVLFIDEIHRLPRVTEEILYPAMEDARLDIPFRLLL